jgi:hypothetical protein
LVRSRSIRKNYLKKIAGAPRYDIERCTSGKGYSARMIGRLLPQAHAYIGRKPERDSLAQMLDSGFATQYNVPKSNDTG